MKKRPSLPVCAEQFANVAPRREFVGVQGGLSLNTDMTVCTWNLVRVVIFRGSVVVGPMRLAFVVRARLKRGKRDVTIASVSTMHYVFLVDAQVQLCCRTH